MKQWIIQEQNECFFSLEDSIQKILQRRGIAQNAMPDFLAENPKTSYDPFLLDDLGEAVDMILDAASKKERVCVYGDYDADGLTSTALLISVLKVIFNKPTYYIPSRFSDGYGLNNQALDYIKERGCDLLITVDCGSTSKNEIEYAKSIGLKAIVTDHHNINVLEAPDCLFVNPHKEGNEYPFAELSGCGIAFKLAQGLQRRMHEIGDERISKSDLLSLLDLVAISTVADVVPLLDENRSFVKYGLKCINSGNRLGIKTLLEVLGNENKEIDTDRIGFLLAPNINALGRIGKAEYAVELFCSIKPDGSQGRDPYELASIMKEANMERKSQQEKAALICKKEMEEKDCGKFFKIIRAEGAHEGVTGIVSGNIKENLYLPVCIVTPTEDGTLKGTGRSTPSINMYDIFCQCSELFVKFGGHAGACGFVIEEQNLDEFRSRAQAIVEKLAKENPEILVEKLYIEKELNAKECTLEFAKMLQKLQPFGEKNSKPIFAIRGITPMYTKRIGVDGRHIRFTAKRNNAPNLDCVLFRKADEYADLLYSGASIDVAGELSVNEYNGNEKLQFIVSDIKEVN